jgi:2,3-bisphosphoglycerate-dependent phosphoglycerate mutase
MTIIYLIRHAQPDFAVHNDMERPLTEVGLESCNKVISYLLDKQITEVLSSPYKRALDTVQGFADLCGRVVLPVYDLRERAVDTDWIEDFSEFVSKQWENFDYKLEGGESLNQVQTRCIRALEAIVSQHQNKNIVIGSHGTAISTIINYYDKDYGLDHFNRIRGIMPFVAKLVFEDKGCSSIEIIDIMGNEERKLYERASESSE